MIRNTIVFHGHNQAFEITPSLSVLPASLHFSWEADSDIVTVNVAIENQVWSVSAALGHAPAWGYVSGASEIGDDAVTIGVYENTTGSLRDGTVTFSSDECDDVVITIHQAANPI